MAGKPGNCLPVSKNTNKNNIPQSFIPETQENVFEAHSKVKSSSFIPGGMSNGFFLCSRCEYLYKARILNFICSKEIGSSNIFTPSNLFSRNGI